MLNGKIAMALAAAMVLAALYGCSSSGVKNDRDEALRDLDTANEEITALENRIYGEDGTAEMPTADSLMGQLAASGMANMAS